MFRSGRVGAGQSWLGWVRESSYVTNMFSCCASGCAPDLRTTSDLCLAPTCLPENRSLPVFLCQQVVRCSIWVWFDIVQVEYQVLVCFFLKNKKSSTYISMHLPSLVSWPEFLLFSICFERQHEVRPAQLPETTDNIPRSVILDSLHEL